MSNTVRYAEYEALIDRFESAQDPVHLQAAFRLLDLNGDGFVSRTELLAYYTSRENSSDAQFVTDKLFQQGDVNRDGYLSFREFEKLVRAICAENARTKAEYKEPEFPEEEASPFDLACDQLISEYSETQDPAILDSLFHLIDRDHDGVVTREELRASALVKGTADEATAANRMMALGDLNQDGVLSLDEFRELIAGMID